MSIHKLILVRHGESQWNLENRFTGWEDIELSKRGKIEAKEAGKFLKKENYFFDCAYTSFLKRAIHTLWIILDEMNLSWISVKKSWRLNERHYGALQGMKKNEIEKKYGYKKVMDWRRSFSVVPPQIHQNDPRFPGNDFRYSNLSIKDLPLGESLSLTVNRILPYWKKKIFPTLHNKKKILVVAHGNSIRAILFLLSKMKEEEISKVEILTGKPLVCEFLENMKFNKFYYLNCNG